MGIGRHETVHDLHLDDVRRAWRAQGLGAVERVDDSLQQVRKQASVAMILRQRSGLEVLLIERAARSGDPWSGQVAMPGGRRDATDEDLVTTAIRETSEEVGVVIDRSQRFGGLSPMQGHRRIATMEISAELFAAEPETEVGEVQQSEVAGSFWVRLDHLVEAANAVHYIFGDGDSSFPGILLPDGRNVLWGLTHRFIDRMLDPLGHALARPDPVSPTLRSERTPSP